MYLAFADLGKVSSPQKSLNPQIANPKITNLQIKR
jgi:hypothetical protein